MRRERAQGLPPAPIRWRFSRAHLIEFVRLGPWGAGSDVEVDVDGGVVGGGVLGGGDVGVDGPLGGRVHVGGRAPQAAAFDPADDLGGECLGHEDVVEPVA